MGDSGDGGDGSFGMPPADCRNCHPYPLHDGHDDGDGVFGILPRKSCNRHAAVLLSEAARRRIAGRKTCHKGVQRERLAHGSLQGKVECVPPCKRSRKNRRDFSDRRGDFTRPKRAGESHACILRLRGVLP